jgi:hypothetical protein
VDLYVPVVNISTQVSNEHMFGLADLAANRIFIGYPTFIPSMLGQHLVLVEASKPTVHLAWLSTFRFQKKRNIQQIGKQFASIFCCVQLSFVCQQQSTVSSLAKAEVHLKSLIAKEFTRNHFFYPLPHR